MHVDEKQILSLSREVWEAQLGLHLAPGAAESSAADPTLASRIAVSGACSGAILFECPASVARHAAAMLFAADGESTTDEEIQDAVNELAEMIGRKVRGLLPDAAKLSRAEVVGDDERERSLEAMAGVSDLQLSCEGRPVRIVVLHDQNQGASEFEPAPAA